MKAVASEQTTIEYDRGPDVAVGLIENKDKPEHFLVQYRSGMNPQYAGYLEFPGGKVESGETVDMALIREIEEEVGIAIKKIRWFTSMDYRFPSGLLHNVHFYEIPHYEGEPIGKEGQRIGWLTLYQLATYPNMLPLNRAAAIVLTTERHPDILGA
jgi:8-oxo-dGTP diphosphatase